MNSYKDWIIKNRMSIDRLIAEGELDYWIDQYPDESFEMPVRTVPFQTMFAVNCEAIMSNVDIQNCVITAYISALSKTLGCKEIVIEREGHGRNSLGDYDVSNLIGWFTSKFPTRYKVTEDLIGLLGKVRQINSAIPNAGVGYGVIKHLSPAYISQQLNFTPRFSINFLGDLSVTSSESSRGLIQSAHSTFASTLGRLNEKKNGAEHQPALYWTDINFWAAAGTLHLQVMAGEQMGFVPDSWRSFLATLSAAIVQLFNANQTTEREEQLTPFQRGLVSYVLNNPDANRYIVQLSVQFDDALDFKVFRAACEILTSRHEILRTCYSFDYDKGKFLARILPQNTMVCEEVILENDREEDIITICQRLKEGGFDISNKPLIKFALLKSAGNRNIVVITAHHVILDGHSISILFQQCLEIVSELKNGKLPEKAWPAKLQFAHYLKWINGLDKGKAVDYWRAKLESFQDALIEPLIANDKSESEETFNQWEEIFDLSGETIDVLQKKGVTISAAFNFLTGFVLSRYNGVTKFVWGNVVTLRPFDLSEAENILGPCISTMPVAMDHGNNKSFLESIKDLQLQVLESLGHAHLTTQEISNALNKTTLFNTLFAFQNYQTGDQPSVDNIKVREQQALVSSHFPLTIVFEQNVQKAKLKMSYRTDQFARFVIEDIGKAIFALFNALAEIGSRKVTSFDIFSFPTFVPPSKLIGDVNGSLGGQTLIHQKFVEVAKRYPEKVAVREADGSNYTYEELDKMSNFVAQLLLKGNIKGPIGICMERSAKMVVSVIGVLKSGGSVVSLENTFPEERVRWINSELQLRAIIASAETGLSAGLDNIHQIILPEKIPFGLDPINLPSVKPTDICSVNYTSGSSGVPKMVITTHVSHLNRIDWITKKFPSEEDDQFCFKTLLAFAPAMREIFEPLTQGATLCIFPENTLQDLDQFAHLLQHYKVTRVFLTPTFLKLITDSEMTSCLIQIRYLEISGEPVKKQLLKTLRSKLPRTILLNRYGATECASVVYDDLTLEENSSHRDTYPLLGAPIQNTNIFIVDESLQLLPRGVVGEILIESASIAAGYSNVSQEKGVFESSSYTSGQKILRTGDLGYINESGKLYYRGRKTRMVKIRGFRVEPREIELVIESNPLISAAVVVPIDLGTTQQLIAFCSFKDPQKMPKELAELKAFLNRRLPGYMQPHEIQYVDKIPMTLSGKVDFVALKALVKNDADDYTAVDLTDTRQKLLTIMKGLLPGRRIESSASFFEMGLDSIVSLMVIHEIKKQFSVAVPVQDLYIFNTIPQLSDYLNERIVSPCTEGDYYTINEKEGNDILYLFPPAGGNSLVYNAFKPYLPKGVTAVVFHLPKFKVDTMNEDDSSIVKIASHYSAIIKSVSENKPVNLAGWSLGGTIAYEVAVQMNKLSIPVQSLTLIDPGFNTGRYDGDLSKDQLRALIHQLNGTNDGFKLPEEELDQMYASGQLIRNYKPEVYPGNIRLVKPEEVLAGERNASKPYNGLEKFCLGKISVTKIPGNHLTMMHALEKLISVVTEKITQ
jgi:amino acid adenylation domain-containing protein